MFFMAEELPWLILTMFPHISLPTHIEKVADMETLIYAFIIYAYMSRAGPFFSWSLDFVTQGTQWTGSWSITGLTHTTQTTTHMYTCRQFEVAF